MAIREGTGSREGRATGGRYGGAVPVSTGGGSAVRCGFWVAGLGGLGGRIFDVWRAQERPGTTGRWKLPASELGSVPPWALAAT